MEQTLLRLLKEIVNHPDDIKVEKIESHPGFIELHISANDEDKGIIIGKNGRSIKALSDIIAIKALKENKRAVLKID